MSENDILYHYTSFDALCNIVGEKEIKIWATDIKYLNDAAESKYGLDMAKRVYKSLSIDDIVPELNINKEREYVISFLENYLPRKDMGSYTYVFSLTQKGDLLSQWRAYCPDGGVSIGFTKEILARLGEKQSFKLIQCIYEPEEQEEKLRQVLTGESEQSQPIEDFSSFFDVLMRAIAALKHPEFREEAEFRLVSRSRKPLELEERKAPYTHKSRWRGARTMPIRYTELFLSNLKERLNLPNEEARSIFAHIPVTSSYGYAPIRDIYVGPSAHQDLALEAVQDFINERLYVPGHGSIDRESIVRARSSKIPYRAK